MSLADPQSGDDGMSSQVIRLPSTRPIDRRWNRSRGIILSNAKRNTGGNFTWSQGDGIVFSNTPASRRDYASRRVFTEQNKAPQASTKTPQGPDLVNAPHLASSRAIPSKNLYDELNREKSAHQATVRTYEAMKEQAKRESKKELEQTRAEVEEQKGELAAQYDAFQARLVAENAAVLQREYETERRALSESLKQSLIDQDKAKSEHKRNVERTLELEKLERQLNALQSNLESRKGGLDNTIATAYREAEEAAKNKYESKTASAEGLWKEARAKMKALEKSEEDLASTAKEQQQQSSATIDRLTKESSLNDQQHEKALNEAAAERVFHEIRELKQDLTLRHDVERKDYETYHALWDQIGDKLRDYAQETGRLADRLDRLKVDRWQHNVRSFNRWKDTPRLSDRWKESSQAEYDTPQFDTSFSRSYPSLSRQLEHFLQSSAEQTSRTANDLKDLRQGVFAARKALNKEAHFSRKLTKYHHFEEGSNMYSKMSLVASTLNEDQLSRDQDELRVKSDLLEQKLKASTIGSKRESLRQEVQRLRSMVSLILKLKKYFRAVRDVQALEELYHDSISEKTIFAVTQQARDSQEEAWSDWSQLVEENRFERPGEQQQSDRTEFRELYTKVRVEREDLARQIRKRTLLEEHLEESKDGSRYDSIVKKELEKAERERDESLEKVVRSGGGSAAFVRQPVAPRMTAIKPSPLVRKTEVPVEPQTKADTRSTNAIEAEIATLKRRLKESETNEGTKEKEKDTRRLEHLRIVVAQRTIDSATRKTAEMLQKSSVDHAAVLRMQKEIDRLVAALAKLTARAKSSSAEEDKAASRPQAAVSRPLPLKDRRLGRGRLRIRKHGSEKGSRRSLSGASDAATASSEIHHQRNSSSGVMSFKPTAAMRTSSPYWSAHARTLSAASSNSGSAHVASPSLQSSRGSSLTPDRPVRLSQAIRQLSLESSRAEPQQHVDITISTSFGFFSSNNAESSSDMKNVGSDNLIDKFISPDLQASSSRSSNDDPPSSDSSPEHSSPTLSEDSLQGSIGAEQGDQTDMQVKLAYQMPVEVYRNALLASPNTNAAFWSYKLYKNASGKSPLVFYCVSYDTAEARAREFLNEQIIGFDMEWEPFAKRGKSTIKQNVSLIQIAAEDKIGLFHIALFNGDTPDELVPPSLRAILESRNIAKAGVNISGDATRLRQHLNVDMRGVFEVSHLYRIVELKASQVNKRAVKLSEQVQKVLGLPLMKGSVQTSAWSKKLHLEQTEYAASDSYAGFRLYHALEAKRELMKPMPPRPAFWEDHQPLQLGDGSLVMPKPTYAAKVKREIPDETEEEAKEDDDEGEEYFDTVEEVDAARVEPLATQESFQSHASSDESFVSLGHPEDPSDADEAFEDQPQWSQYASQTIASEPAKPSTHHHKATKQPQPIMHPEVRRAELWVASWRASLPVEYNLKVRHSNLRAYHMWHEQGLNCYDVAALLREPPLVPHTVASYIMEALKEEDLPFDAERVKEPLGILPKIVHGRYRKVLEKIGPLK